MTHQADSRESVCECGHPGEAHHDGVPKWGERPCGEAGCECRGYEPLLSPREKLLRAFRQTLPVKNRIEVP